MARFIIEQLKVIDPLTNPTAHGGTAADAFDVVIPSLPGHGFSGAPTNLGWDPIRIARAWVILMKRLGYKKYVAQGGDWGNAVTEQMALLGTPELVGIHTNMPATVPDDVAHALQSGGSTPLRLSTDEKYAYDQLDFFYKHGLAYAQEMSNRPQTLYGVEDSPVGLAAWMLDHDARSYELIARVFAGRSEGLTRDDVLDNITLYWLTHTAVSSARLYWESKLPFFAPKGVTIPVAVSAYPDEIYTAPEVGQSTPIRNSFITTGCSKGGISQRGSSLRVFRKNCVRVSGRFAEDQFRQRFKTPRTAFVRDRSTLIPCSQGCPSGVHEESATMTIEFEVRQNLSTTCYISTASDFLDPLVVHVRKISNECLFAPRPVVRCSPGDLISSMSVRNRHRNRASGAASTDGSSIGRWQAAARASPVPLPHIAVLMLRSKWHRSSQ